MSSDIDIRAQYLGTNNFDTVPIRFLILFSVIFNGIIFYRLPSSITPLNRSYIVSTIHAAIAVLSVIIYYLCSAIDLTQTNRIVGSGLKGTPDEAMAYILSYTVGYFIYDTLLMLLYKSVRSTASLFHHVLIGGAISAGLFTQIGHGCHFLYLMEELSTIPLNMKTLLSHHRYLYNFLSYLFAFTFLLVRMGYGTMIGWYTFVAVPSFIRLAAAIGDRRSIALVLIQVILCIMTRILNGYWTMLIVRKIYAGVSGDKRKKSSKDESKTNKND